MPSARLRRRELFVFAALALSAAAWLTWATLRGDGAGLVAAGVGAVSIAAAFGFSRLVARRRRFCPTCGRLVAHGVLRRRGEFAYCFVCQELADPSAVLCGAPGLLDLSRPQLLARIPATTRLFCDYMVVAILDRATEIALVPQKDRLDVTFVVEGVRRDVVPPPFHIAAALIATIKAVAGLHARSTPNCPRGLIDIAFAEAHVQTEVEVQQGQFGEDIVLQLPGTDMDVRAVAAARRLAYRDAMIGP